MYGKELCTLLWVCMFGVKSLVSHTEELTLHSLGDGLGNSSKSLGGKKHDLICLFALNPDVQQSGLKPTAHLYFSSPHRY